MFYAVQAALVQMEVRMPKTHSGAINLFGRYYIRTERLDKRLATDLRQAYNLRQKSDYEVYAEVGEEQVKEVVENAEAFVREVKRLLG